MAEGDWRNKAMKAAYWKGYRAREAGRPQSACPYKDKRGGYKNMVTFSQSFIRAWHDGWQTAQPVEGPR
jgi:ribosome modulation factor